MTYVATVVQVLLSSPSDLPLEHRDLINSTIRTWNTNYSRHFGVLFSPTDWQEGTSPSYGQEPQAFINEQLVASSDMGLIVFTNRLGTPTKTHLSGTVEEIDLLHSRGKRVAILRNLTPSTPVATTDAIQQLAILDEYLRSIRDKALYSNYSTNEQLTQIINNTLNNVARNHAGPRELDTPPSQSSTTNPSSAWPLSGIGRYTITTPSDQNKPLITQHDLDRLGIKSSDPERLLREVNDTLYERVGLEIVAHLSDSDLDELLHRQETDDASTMTAWLSKRVAHLDEIVSDERTIILGDLAKQADELSDAI
jgi:hypothetical protein